MRVPLLYCAALTLPLAGARGADPSLEFHATVNGRVLQVEAVFEQQVLLRDATGPLLVEPDAVTWQLGGDPGIAENAALIRWAVPCEIVRSQRPDREVTADSRWYARLALTVYPSPPRGVRDPSEKLDEIWTGLFAPDTLAVSAWVLRGRVEQVKVRVVPAAPTVGFSFANEFALNDLSAAHGHAIALVWRPAAFLAPRPHFGRAATDAAVLACVTDDVPALEAALAAGASLRHTTREGNTLLHLAALTGAGQIAAKILQIEPRLAGTRNALQTLPQHLAASGGRTGVTAALLQAGAPWDAVDASGRTALLRAAHRGHTGVVRLLGARGALTKLADRQNHTPFGDAVDAGYADVADILFRNSGVVAIAGSRGTPPLLTQVRLGHTAMVRWLLAHGTDVNAEVEGRTALLVAAADGDAAMADALLDAGARTDFANEEGWNPLHVAVAAGHEAFAVALLQRGAGAAAQTRSGLSALHLAASANSAPLVSHLAEGGAKIDVRDQRGATPLDFALMAGADAAVRELVRRGARLDLQAETAALHVGMATRLDVSDLLARALEDGWAVDRPVEGNLSLLDLARTFGAQGCLAVLHDPGDDVPTTAIVDQEKLDAVPQVEEAVAMRDFRAEAGSRQPATVRVECVIDATGRPLYARIASTPDPRVATSLIPVFSRWRFSPPLRGGAPIAARAFVDVVFPGSLGVVYESSQVDHVPSPVKGLHRAAPALSANRGSGGRVVIEFVVGTTGVPEQLRVVSTTDPKLVRGALEEVRESRWEIPRVHGQPVRMRMRLPVIVN